MIMTKDILELLYKDMLLLHIKTMVAGGFFGGRLHIFSAAVQNVGLLF